MLTGGLYEGQSNNDKFDLTNIMGEGRDAVLLCPTEVEELPIKGRFNSKEFDFVEITIRGC